MNASFLVSLNCPKSSSKKTAALGSVNISGVSRRGSIMRSIDSSDVHRILPDSSLY